MLMDRRKKHLWLALFADIQVESVYLIHSQLKERVVRMPIIGILYRIRKESGFEIRVGLNTLLLKMNVVNFTQIFRIPPSLNSSCITCTPREKGACCPECTSVPGNAYFKLHQTLHI